MNTIQTSNNSFQLPPSIDWAKRLKVETEQLHQEAETNGIFRRLFDPALALADYRSFLLDLYQRLAPLEAGITNCSALANFQSVQSRNAFSALSRDLTYFQLSAPTEPEPFPISGLGSLAGALYVLEGSAHGGCIFHKHLTQHLQITESTGLAYFSAQASSVHARFKPFREDLNRLLSESTFTDALTSARQVFQRFL